MLEAVRRDLDSGASVDLEDERGRTALWWASEEDRIELAELLLDRGAKADVQDQQGTGEMPQMQQASQVVRVATVVPPQA